MTDRFDLIPAIPRETERAARAVFGRGNFYIQVGEHLETILEDIQLEYTPGSRLGAILPSITFFQFMEGLTDAQAIDALRTRLDWKFALHLRVHPPTFSEKALCEFRQRVFSDEFCQCEFQRYIDRLATFSPQVDSRFQDFKNPEFVSIVCSVNQLGFTYEALCQALEVLACRFPEWLRQVAQPDWYGRYNRSIPELAAIASPSQPEPSLTGIGADIHYLLEQAHQTGSHEINQLEEIRALQGLWEQQFKNSSQALLSSEKTDSRLKQCDSCVKKAIQKGVVKEVHIQ